MFLILLQHVSNWPKSRPLCVHAESKTTAAIILLAELHKRPVHVCHVARREEVWMGLQLVQLIVQLSTSNSDMTAQYVCSGSLVD